MLTGRVFGSPASSTRPWRAALIAFALAALASPLSAQTTPSVSVGAGLQTAFTHTSQDGQDDVSSFGVRDMRLYVNGTAAEHINFMFNTAYTPSDNKVDVLDAVAQISTSAKFNVWFGRFLPPSDRANLYGPFYAHHWGVYSDGVQDGYPFVYQGRQNGAMYWGQFGKVKVSGGGFDGASATGNADLIAAGRVQVDFWDAEDGYYLNGTYYGDKNLLAIGAAGQVQGSGRTAYNLDFLLERKVPVGGAYTVEAQWARYEKLGGYNPQYRVNDGGYILGSYLFPQMAGQGRFEILGKYARARFREGLLPIDANYDQKTTELNLNYVIKQFNARLMMFYKDTRFDAVRSDFKQIGV
ncbi:MAG: hypothetical protein AB7Q29_10175, partial [Vicinamibacterales bacterium]